MAFHFFRAAVLAASTIFAVPALAQTQVRVGVILVLGVAPIFVVDKEGLAKQAKLAHKVSPHALRHSFASHVLQSSQDLRAVQEMLGHASISTTQVYTHLDFQSLAKAYDAAHPRARKLNIKSALDAARIQ